MIFDRYKNKSSSTTTTNEKKKSSLAASFFKRFPNFNKKKNIQEKDISVINQPRTSVSLPNIKSVNKPEPLIQPPPPPPKQRKLKQRNRHSAEQRRRRHHLISIQDANRHSFTFGHLPSLSNNRLSKSDLFLDPDQLTKLNRLDHLIDNTTELLAKLGTSQPPILVPHRSISHQQLTAVVVSHQRQLLSRAHSESHAKTVADPIEPEDLVDFLIAEEPIILIDVRNLMEYQKTRIRGSLNVNLPSLLIKRYQRRGTVSNFNLENFITTLEGREIYARQQPKQWVVYDQDMSEDDQTSQAWTLLNVLERFVGSEGKVYYLCGGFQAFQQQQYDDWLESSSSSGEEMMIPISAGTNNIPRRSVSYTIGESRKNNSEKRTSLFSLDTNAARANNANALARRAKRRSQQLMDANKSSSQLSLLQPQEEELEQGPSSSQTVLIQLEEDDETMAEEISPRTETDFEFTISEIIPSFLYVGPEIETQEQASQLQQRQIKRVLNMAEECEDEGLSKHTMMYHKISARDTLEMKNIELVMMEAVQFIEEAKKSHEPIYVHCKAGKSRSITAILAYLITSERWTLKRAYRHVIKARPNMSPNIGFISELMKMEGKVHGRVSSFLESDWQTTSLPSPEYANELNQLEKAWRTTEIK